MKDITPARSREKILARVFTQSLTTVILLAYALFAQAELGEPEKTNSSLALSN